MSSKNVENRKFPLEEILNYDLNFCMIDKKVSSDDYRPDIKKARTMFTPFEFSLPYTSRNEELLSYGSGIIQLPDLSVPAFGKDPVEEVAGKFDLVMNTMTSLWKSKHGLLEPNQLIFQYAGLIRIPYSMGEKYPDNDPLKSIIHMEVYDDRDEIPQDDGLMYSCRQLEKEMRLMSRVNDAYSLRFGNLSVDPLATLVSFKQLKCHIEETNRMLHSQYVNLLRNETYTKLKEKVVDEHGPESVEALLLHIQSPGMFYDTFLPRGILSSKSTGKTVPFSNGTAYEGIVTLQTTGMLNVDIENGDEHLSHGSTLSNGYLYLIIEMKSLVPGDFKFNYPSIRMYLTSKSVEMVADEILSNTRGRCHLSRNGKLTETIIKPLGKIHLGPHNVHDSCSVDTKQYTPFDILLTNSNTYHVIFSDSYERIVL